jgi:molybdate transport system ATP-binding protein
MSDPSTSLGTGRTLAVAIRKRLSPSFALDLQCSAAPGITILFGASGSGKTTLLRCLAGLERPDSGRITVGDRVLFDAAGGVEVPARGRRVGFVFQQLALFPHLSVSGNIGYGLEQFAPQIRLERVRSIARSFHIDHTLERKPSAISGGERQRTALARALVMDPDLLLLDEPLSALDHATQSRIMADLRAWNAAHAIPILYVTHAHREVFALGERVIVLHEGRTIAEGVPHEVMDAPAHEPMAAITGFENFFDATVCARRPDAGTMQCRLEPGGLPLEVPMSRAVEGSPIRIAIRAGDILLANQEPRGLSARNVLRGRITSLQREGPMVTASVDAGALFAVHVTRGASESLGLTVGDEVWLVIKTHSCRLVASP